MRSWLSWYPLRLAAVVDTVVIALWCLVVGVELAPTDASALLPLALVLVPTTFVALCCTRTSAARWALERGAQFSPEWSDVLHRHLTRTRVARTLGFTGALGLGMVIVNALYERSTVVPADVSPWNDVLSGYWLPGLGYVAGSLVTELTKPRLASVGTGTAVLSRRRLGDYLDNTVREMFVASFVVMALAVTVALLAPRSNGQPGWLDDWGRVGLPLGVAAVAVLGAVWVCRRRERAGDEVALAYEELTRSATANALIGAAVAMGAEAAIRLVGLRTVEGTVSGWYQVGFGLFGLLALGFWAASGTKLVFRNRRISKLRAAAGVASA